MMKELESLNLRSSPPLRAVDSVPSVSLRERTGVPERNKSLPHSAEVLCNPQGTGNELSQITSEMILDLAGHWELKIKPLEVLLM